ncbi:unnamed protein product [Leuciscus chuanchicus]
MSAGRSALVFGDIQTGSHSAEAVLGVVSYPNRFKFLRLCHATAEQHECSPSMGGSLVPAHVKEMDYVAAWPLQLCLSDFNGCTMLLGSPWSVQVLLALSVLTLGLDSEPQSAPRVFLSFKECPTVYDALNRIALSTHFRGQELRPLTRDQLTFLVKRFHPTWRPFPQRLFGFQENTVLRHWRLQFTLRAFGIRDCETVNPLHHNAGRLHLIRTRAAAGPKKTLTNPEHALQALRMLEIDVYVDTW